MKKKKTRLILLLFLSITLIGVSLLAPLLASNNPYATNVSIAKGAPSAAYPFGTDILGRCIYSRVLYGARTSIFMTLLLVVGVTLFGTIVGVLCGYYEGIVDGLFMRVSEILLAFPQMVLAVFVAGVYGGGMLGAMVAMAFAGWIQSAKVARAHVRMLKQEPYIKAAKLSGNSDFKIMTSYILPHIVGLQIVCAATDIGSMMIGIAGLSFLGLGVQPPAAEWGSMIAESRSMFQVAPWGILYPALAIFITVMIFNGLGDCLRDVFDPREQ